MPKRSRASQSRERLRRAAAAAISHGHYHNALSILASAGRECRRDARLCLLHGRALARLYVSDDALERAHQALDLDPDLLAAQLLIGDLHLAQGKLAASTRVFQRIRKQGSRAQRARACGGLAICAAEGRRFMQADEFLAEAFASRPRDHTLWCDRGDVARLADRPRQAAHAYQQAQTIRPRDIWPRLGLARLDYEAGRLARAEATLAGVLRCGREDVGALLLAADVALARSQYQKAGDLYEQAYVVSPKGDYGEEALAAAGEARYRGGDFPAAAQAFRTLAERTDRSYLGRLARRSLRLVSKASTDKKGANGAPARVELTDFPRLRQRWDYCGPAVLAMVLRFWKYSADQDKIGRAIWDSGTPLYQMTGYLRKRGLKAVAFRGTPEALRALLDRGVPTIVEVHTSPYGHFRVAIGYDRLRDTFLLQDPGFIEPAEVRAVELEREWAHEGHWSLAAVPPEQADRLSGIELPGRRETASLDCCRAMMDRDQLDAAQRSLNKRLPLETRCPQADRMRVQIALGRRRLVQAKRLARDATRRYSAAAWPWQLLADAQRLGGHLGQAAQSHRAALRRDPRDYWSHLALGRLALERGILDDAKAYLQQATRLDPESAAPFRSLGALYMRAGRFDEALRSLSRARELAPHNALIWQERGYVLDRLGRWGEAERMLRRALALAPKDPWIQNELAYLLARRNRCLDEALALARRALRGGYQPACDVQDTIGWVLYSRGRVKAALGHLQTAERSARARARGVPADDEPLAEIRLHLGEVLLAAGEQKRGLRALTSVASSGTEFSEAARELLRQLES